MQTGACFGFCPVSPLWQFAGTFWNGSGFHASVRDIPYISASNYFYCSSKRSPLMHTQTLRLKPSSLLYSCLPNRLLKRGSWPTSASNHSSPCSSLSCFVFKTERERRLSIGKTPGSSAPNDAPSVAMTSFKWADTSAFQCGPPADFFILQIILCLPGATPAHPPKNAANVCWFRERVSRQQSNLLQNSRSHAEFIVKGFPCYYICMYTVGSCILYSIHKRAVEFPPAKMPEQPLQATCPRWK